MSGEDGGITAGTGKFYLFSLILDSLSVLLYTKSRNV
jgi:hypothetical protein